MKTILRIVLFTLMMTGTAYTAEAQNKFSVDVRIAGLEEGDTLRFSKVILPQRGSEAGFDIIIGKNGLGKYKGRQEHDQLYSMRYYPKSRTVPDSGKRVADVLIGSGRTKISGTRDYIYYSAVENNLYSKQLQQILALKNSLESMQEDIWNELMEAQDNEDTVKRDSLHNEYDNFRTTWRADYDRLNRMERDYESNPGGEYAALKIVQNTYKSVEELQNSYRKLTPEGKESYYGRIATGIIAKMGLLATGNPAPDIELETVDGKKIRISDFTGKYLLIYHFGLCPASFQINKYVTKLYNEHRDKLEVIGITDSFEKLESFRESIQEGMTFDGMDLRNLLSEMQVQPWTNSVELQTGDNSVFTDTYFAGGMPYFIFISPEGKILSRAIGDEAYRLAQKTLTASE